MQLTENVKKILKGYESESPAVKSNLVKILLPPSLSNKRAGFGISNRSLIVSLFNPLQSQTIHHKSEWGFFTRNTGAPQGEWDGCKYPLLIYSVSCFLISWFCQGLSM